MYLVDTNVISAAAPTKVKLQSDLVHWMERNSTRLYLSVVSVAEIENGIAKAERGGAHHKSARLADWLETLLHLYSENILPLDIPTARLAGRLSDFARGRGHDPGFADVALAATALNRGYLVLTRNLRHFTAMKVPAHDPFVSLPYS